MFQSILRGDSAFDLLVLFIAVVAIPIFSIFTGRQLAARQGATQAA